MKEAANIQNILTCKQNIHRDLMTPNPALQAVVDW